MGEDSIAKADDIDDYDTYTIATDILIVGIGPAGSSLACFLASNGLKGIIITSGSSTANTPRAHITNMAALECLRDIGLEKECVNAATPGNCMLHTRWAHSFCGEEYARIHSWGNDPRRLGDYDAASPCKHVDLPQTILEPILVRYATQHGFNCRFDTDFTSFARSRSGLILSNVRDKISNQSYTIRSKYLFGCDGARSQVMRELQIPLLKEPGQGLAINVLVKVDLTEPAQNRIGNLHWIVQPGEEFPNFGWVGIARMVKPWTEWMFILLPAPGTGVDLNPTDQECLKRVKEMIGDDSKSVELLEVSKWFINEIVAEYYSEDNVFCLGDAVHRHPPINGLGSNTCVQDAFNLAWKIAYVMRGQAGPALLDSYSLERQPVGQAVVARANQGLRDHVPVWEALGLLEPSPAQSKKALAELSEDSETGRDRRNRLETAVQHTAHEFHAVGVEMNQNYLSTAVFLDDEGPRPPLPSDPILEYQITTYPGSRLPHAWLNKRLPGSRISTIDLAGHGKFCLLTGIGGKRWTAAAKKVGQEIGVEIQAYSIGWLQDYEDVYSDWARRREIQENGCILVRPDRFIAWRSDSIISECEEKLLNVMKIILSRYES